MGAVTMSNAASSNIAFHLGLRGLCESIASGCASGTHAVGDAARLIRWGVCDAVISGGSDAPRSAEAERGGFVSAALKNLRVHTEDEIVRPFDVKRSGFILSDGAAVLVLEEMEAAKARGARIYAEVVGYGNTVDGYDIIAPEPTGEGVRRCMEAALAEAGRSGDEVRFVNTHGTATRSNDLAETLAIHDLCGVPGPAVNSIKGVTGHSGPAAGAIEAASVALAIQRKVIPPTVGLEDPAPEIEVDLVYGEARPWEPGLSISTSLGLGGHTGAIALVPVD
jgi:3-oxoacyl-[acyl-carrier-protein] synthase II